MNIFLFKKFSVQPEIVYSEQGAILNVDLSIVSSDPGFLFRNKLSYNYIQIPINLKYQVLERVSVVAGPQIGFLTSAKIKTFESRIEEFNNRASTDENVNKVDYGLNLGFDVKIWRNFSMLINQYLGFRPVFKSEFSEEKNRVTQVSLVYKF